MKLNCPPPRLDGFDRTPVATAVLTGGGFGAEKTRALGPNEGPGGSGAADRRSRRALCYRHHPLDPIDMGPKRGTPRLCVTGFSVNWAATWVCNRF